MYVSSYICVPQRSTTLLTEREGFGVSLLHVPRLRSSAITFVFLFLRLGLSVPESSVSTSWSSSSSSSDLGSFFGFFLPFGLLPFPLPFGLASFPLPFGSLPFPLSFGLSVSPSLPFLGRLGLLLPSVSDSGWGSGSSSSASSLAGAPVLPVATPLVSYGSIELLTHRSP